MFNIRKTIILFVTLVSLLPLHAQVAFSPVMFGVHHRNSGPKLDFGNLTINSGTTVTATTLITAQPGVTITQKGICYSTSPTPTIDNAKTADGSGTASYNSNISSLTTGTIYYVRPYATVGSATYYGTEKRMAVFYYTGGPQNFTIPPEAGSAKIRVFGAQGGSSYSSSPGLASGGLGALMEGIFSLTPGNQITFDVGQKGGDGYPFYVLGSGGGGGTFVYSGTTIKSPLIIAGGGGGGIVYNSTEKANGQDGQAGPNGTSGLTYQWGTSVGGTNGSGGASAYGGGGAGWYSAGSNNSGRDIGGRRDPWLGGNSGSSYGRGGYEGGGSAWYESQGGSAGSGGGWSGGGSPINSVSSGGGGGSYNSAPAATQYNSTGVQTGNGVAIITW